MSWGKFTAVEWLDVSALICCILPGVPIAGFSSCSYDVWARSFQTILAPAPGAGPVWRETVEKLGPNLQRVLRPELYLSEKRGVAGILWLPEPGSIGVPPLYRGLYSTRGGGAYYTATTWSKVVVPRSLYCYSYSFSTCCCSPVWPVPRSLYCYGYSFSDLLLFFRSEEFILPSRNLR